MDIEAEMLLHTDAELCSLAPVRICSCMLKHITCLLVQSSFALEEEA
jgi:hypothetical protein